MALYDWGDGKGRVHSRPKRTARPLSVIESAWAKASPHQKSVVGGFTNPRPGENRFGEPKPGGIRPPYGSYDPALDQQERAAGRGIGDLIDDIARGNVRSGQDYGLGQQSIERARGRGTMDLGTEKSNTELGFARLADRQRQMANATGNRGSAVAEGARKRGANYDRFLADWTERGRRLTEDADLGQANLGLGFTRNFEDQNLVALPRAQRENTIFGQDINELRIDQAKQAGLLPEPAKPRRKRKPRRR